MTAASIALRNEVQSIGRPVLAAFRSQDVRAALEVRFDSRPRDVSANAFADATRTAMGSVGQPVVMEGFSMLARRLEHQVLRDYVLFPSPRFLWERYRYRGSDWHGLVHSLVGLQAGPSFVDTISWDSALMWRVEDDDLLWSIQRRLNDVNYCCT